MSEISKMGDLPNGWISTTIGEISEFVTSGSRNWSKYYSTEGALFVRTQDIKHNRLADRDIPRVKLPEKVEGKRTRIQKGDLLITITGYIGRVAAIDDNVEEAYVSQSVALVRLRNPDYSKFIQLQLLERRRGVTQLEAMAYGLGRPVLNLDNIRKARIAIAPVEQQKYIVSEIEKQFSRLDEAVANLKRVKVNLKRYKAAVLKAAVEGRLIETEAELARREGRSYETGAQLLQRILETRRHQWKGKGKYKEHAAPDTTDLPELPEGWVWASTGQVCGSVRDGTHDTPAYVETGVPLITSKNLTDQGIDFENVKLISEQDHAQISRRSEVVSGDVLFAMIGTVGNPCEIKTDAQFSIKNVGLFKRNPEFLNSAYLCYWLDSPLLNKWLGPRLKGTTQKFAPLGLLRELPVPYAPLAEQRRIVVEIDRLESMHREFELSVESNLRRSDNLRSQYLLRAFRGTI